MARRGTRDRRTRVGRWVPLALVGFLVLAGSLPVGLGALAPSRAPVPPPARSPIEHVVEIMMENHAFDNLFGTFPGAVGFAPNTTVPNGEGGTVAPYWIPGNSTPDLPHDRASELADLDGGRMDGFVEEMAKFNASAPDTPMGYYNASQVPGYWALARAFVLCDEYFAPVLGPTVPNRLYAIAGSSAGVSSDTWPAGGVRLPTIFDQLTTFGLGWNYYAFPGPTPVPLRVAPLRDTPAEVARVVPMSGLLPAIRAGELPAVTFVDPEASRVVSEHPPESVTSGEEWSLRVIDAIEAGPQWGSTVVFLTWDEGGGFYDGVVPPTVDGLGDGFRVPLLVVSPFAESGGISNAVLDHTSILKFIEQNWGLPYLNARVAEAGSAGATLALPIP